MSDRHIPASQAGSSSPPSSSLVWAPTLRARLPELRRSADDPREPEAPGSRGLGRRARLHGDARVRVPARLRPRAHARRRVLRARSGRLSPRLDALARDRRRVLVLAFAHALTRSRTVALVAAAIFAVHPMAAESVAWASGRKDQVSLVFLLLVARRGARPPAPGRMRAGSSSRPRALARRDAREGLGGRPSRCSPASSCSSCAPTARAIRARGRPRSSRLGVRRRRGRRAPSLRSRSREGPRARRDGHDGVGALPRLPRSARRLRPPPRRADAVSRSITSSRGRTWSRRSSERLVLVALPRAAVVVLWQRPRVAARMLALAAAWFLAALLPFNGVFPQTSVAMADRYAFDALPALGLAAGARWRRWPRWPRVARRDRADRRARPARRALRAAEFRDSETVFRAARARRARRLARRAQARARRCA